MHLLLLAYYFPPDGGPGAQRPISFARHLPGLGVRCTVVTRAVPVHRGEFDPADDRGLVGIDEQVRIVRAAALAVGFPALHEALLAAAEEVIASDRPDVVMATMSPFELAAVANELSARHGIASVLDLRDPWALDGVQDHRSWWHWRRELRTMREHLADADGIVCNTNECRLAVASAMPELDPDRFEVITNGWEPCHFGEPAQVREPGDVLRLVHVGSFLCDQLYADERRLRRLLGWLRYRAEPILPEGRTPLPLLRAIHQLREQGHAAGAETRLEVFGRDDPDLHRCVRESGVADCVTLHGYRPHAEAIEAVKSADALFLTLHGLAPGHRSRIVPGKAYEYLASGRPILAGLPAGDARELVSQSPRAFVADPCDANVIAAQLAQLHEAWRRGAFRSGECPADLDRYERGALARRLAEFVNRIVARRRG